MNANLEITETTSWNLILLPLVLGRGKAVCTMCDRVRQQAGHRLHPNSRSQHIDIPIGGLGCTLQCYSLQRFGGQECMCCGCLRWDIRWEDVSYLSRSLSVAYRSRTGQEHWEYYSPWKVSTQGNRLHPYLQPQPAPVTVSWRIYYSISTIGRKGMTPSISKWSYELYILFLNEKLLKLRNRQNGISSCIFFEERGNFVTLL